MADRASSSFSAASIRRPVLLSALEAVSPAVVREAGVRTGMARHGWFVSSGFETERTGLV